jgi:heme-degrading monooxygenase HmoA
MAGVHIRVWEYEVATERIDAFIAAYGVDGDWAQLFRQARGHLGTELYRRIDDPSRFATVDRWTDEAAWHGFLEEHGEAYGRLDAVLAPLTTSQSRLVEGTS